MRSVTRYKSGSALDSSHDKAVLREKLLYLKPVTSALKRTYFSIDMVQTRMDPDALHVRGIYFLRNDFLRSGEKTKHWTTKSNLFRSLSTFYLKVY